METSSIKLCLCCFSSLGFRTSQYTHKIPVFKAESLTFCGLQSLGVTLCSGSWSYHSCKCTRRQKRYKFLGIQIKTKVKKHGRPPKASETGDRISIRAKCCRPCKPTFYENRWIHSDSAGMSVEEAYCWIVTHNLH